MPPLAAPIDYESQYRAALRRIAQAKAREDALHAQLLHVTGRLLGIVQEITTELHGLQREARTQHVGQEMESMLNHSPGRTA